VVELLGRFGGQRPTPTRRPCPLDFGVVLDDVGELHLSAGHHAAGGRRGLRRPKTPSRGRRWTPPSCPPCWKTPGHDGADARHGDQMNTCTNALLTLLHVVEGGFVLRRQGALGAQMAASGLTNFSCGAPRARGRARGRPARQRGGRRRAGRAGSGSGFRKRSAEVQRPADRRWAGRRQPAAPGWSAGGLGSAAGLAARARDSRAPSRAARRAPPASRGRARRPVGRGVLADEVGAGSGALGLPPAFLFSIPRRAFRSLMSFTPGFFSPLLNACLRGLSIRPELSFARPRGQAFPGNGLPLRPKDSPAMVARHGHRTPSLLRRLPMAALMRALTASGAGALAGDRRSFCLPAPAAVPRPPTSSRPSRSSPRR
jgi:hypothetical protein